MITAERSEVIYLHQYIVHEEFFGDEREDDRTD